MKKGGIIDELREMLEASEKDDMLAAQCWLAARGIDPQEAGPAQLIGAIREVRAQQAQQVAAKALYWIASFCGRKE